MIRLSLFFIPNGQRKVYSDTKREHKQSVSEVRMWQTTCHATTFLSASLLKDCVLLLPFFVFKWTVNDFDVSVGTLAIRESTLASIPCQGLTLNWRAAVNKLVHTHRRDGLLQFVWGLFVVPITRCPANGKREEEGGAKRAVDDL